jgi:hypothetical protein
VQKQKGRSGERPLFVLLHPALVPVPAGATEVAATTAESLTILL